MVKKHRSRKIVNPTQEVLKQPLHTTIAIDTLDFSDFNVEEKMHIVMSVKDFKAIVMHAGILNTKISASYSVPQRPLQLKYIDGGMTSEFILMTIGDYRGASATPQPGAVRAGSKRPVPRELEHRRSEQRSMPPPSRPPPSSISRDATRSRITRPSPPPPQPSIQDNALFFTEADDDNKWDPTNYDEEEEEMLGWDASADNVSLRLKYNSSWNMLITREDATGVPYKPSLQNNDPLSQSINGASKQSMRQETQQQRLPPTQRMSQVCQPLF